MCGRVVVASPREVLAGHLGVHDVVAPDLGPRWNVAPTVRLYAVAGAAGGRRLGTMTWGLLPSWAASPSTGLRGPNAAGGPRPINARVESLLVRPHFAGALAGRRCLVPVDGFYEWSTAPDGARRPHYLASPDGSPLAIAALWDRWSGPESEPIVSCAVVTTAANADVAPLHDRMPALVAPEDWDEWLDPANHDVGSLLDLLRPAPDGRLAVRPVSRRVNSVANDDPDLLGLPEPEPEPEPTLFG